MKTTSWLVTLTLLLIAKSLPAASSLSLSQSQCERLRETRLQMGLLGLNVANAQTTRTPEGGPFLPFRIRSCKNGTCDVERDHLPIFKYLPGHPDANAEGFVSFPNINLSSEQELFGAAANRLRILAAHGACDVKLLGNGKSILLMYQIQDGPPDLAVREDILTFTENDQITAWQRVSAGGTVVANFQFQPRDSVISER